MFANFAEYDPSRWVEDGLVKAVPQRKKFTSTGPRRKQPWTTSVLPAVVFFSAATLAVVSVSTVAVSRPVAVAAEPVAKADDLVGPSFWNNVESFLAAERAASPAIDRSDIEDPDFLI